MNLRLSKWTLALGLTWWGLAGCATTDEGSEAKAELTHYTLRAGPRMPLPTPLPARTDIFVDWYAGAAQAESKLGFRGWDFGGDSRFEMVEVLGPDGKTEAYVYDFDGDGRADVTKDAAKP